MSPILLLIAALASAPGARAVETGIDLEVWGDAYASGDPRMQGWFRETLELSASPSRQIFFRVAWVIERDSHGDILRDDLYQSDDRGIQRSATRFRDLLLGARAGPVTLELGRQRLTWGRTTFVNATDNLTPRDWTDPLDEVRLSPWSARLSVERDRAWGEAVLVPHYAPSRLPILGGRWFTIEGTPAAPIAASYGDDDLPPVTWSTLQAAARGGYRGSRGEAVLSYFRGYDDAPVLTPRVGAPDPATGAIPVALDRSAARLEVAGADGELLFGSWIVRGEGGYFHYPGGERDGFFLFQAEAQWSRGNWQAIAGYGDTIGDETAITPTALDYAYLPAVFARGAYGEASEWQVAVEAIVGTKQGDGLIRLSGSYPFAGHVRAGAEVAMMWGDPGTFFGRWSANDRLRLFVRCAF